MLNYNRDIDMNHTVCDPISQKKLLLASASHSRKKLLDVACIPYDIIQQDADEFSLDWSQPTPLLVKNLAELKMDHAVLPTAESQHEIYVVTADTLCHDGVTLGKPKTREEAVRMIRDARTGILISTGFCLDKKRADNHKWTTIERISQTVTARCTIDIPEKFINYYLTHVDVFSIAGAIAIEGLGSLFVKEIRGSYTTIIGLPLFELSAALDKLGFFS